ncbi:hypothetical protein [Cellulosimicrobium protaetiae]|uniref:Uncharacterized protein n=1 Tax=Cellulosimicrobium protaetiae TaxID=2587808 RepID=A0A6M5U8G1_9MICO|nr:hypothetical protein [Cellulosimicrobium protaetiae]QJW34817.1 hypothetical protein FIC82_013050 [Cellulosimicrobium protaetiae]
MTDGSLRPVPGPPRGGRPEGPTTGQDGEASSPVVGPLDAALGRLDGLENLTTADHVGVLEDVHDALVAELARTED